MLDGKTVSDLAADLIVVVDLLELGPDLFGRRCLLHHALDLLAESMRRVANGESISALFT